MNIYSFKTQGGRYVVVSSDTHKGARDYLNRHREHLVTCDRSLETKATDRKKLNECLLEELEDWYGSTDRSIPLDDSDGVFTMMECAYGMYIMSGGKVHTDSEESDEDDSEDDSEDEDYEDYEESDDYEDEDGGPDEPEEDPDYMDETDSEEQSDY
jgi:hypothetical protein